MSLLAEATSRSSLLTLAVWLALALFRVRNPRTQLATWSGVLLASLSMPLLMRLVPMQTMTLPSVLYQMPAKAVAAAIPSLLVDAGPAPLPPSSLLEAAYLTIASIFLARLGVGLIRGLSLVHRSERIRAAWAPGRDIRISADLAMPAAIGRTILLPTAFREWSGPWREAVLSHEASHVDRGDFYLLMLAKLHRALFWFNPLSWWLNTRLIDLAEANSDAAALAATGDRLSYAQILIHLASQTREIPAGLAMAAHATVRRRVEHILTEQTLPAQLDARGMALIAAGLLPAALIAAGAAMPGRLDKFVGYYALAWSPEFPLKVYREGNRLFANPIGLAGMELQPGSGTKFRSRHQDAEQEFKLDMAGHVTAVTLRQNGGDFNADRLDDQTGRALEQALADRIAANRSQPGSEAALLDHISQLQRGEIDTKTLAPGMGDAIRGMLPEIRPQFLALGAVRSVQFTGVNPDGMDGYRVLYDKGGQQWSIRLSRDGHIDSLFFAPLP